MSEQRIYSAMLAIMREIGGIEKDKKNQQQGFQYRGIDQVYAAIHPLMIKHGVFMRAEILDKHREERVNPVKQSVLAFTTLRMRYYFVAEDGSSIYTEAEGEGMDSGDKSSNKAMAIAHKYAILQALCVPTEQVDDPDAEVHEVASHKRGSKEAAKEVAERKLAELRAQQPTEMEQKLSESISEVNKGKMIEIVQAFGELKKQLVAVQQESVYYSILELHHVSKSNQFKNIEDAKKCYKAMAKAVTALKGTEVIVNA